jgi:nucleoside 2-deoxyribosyltransferase
MKLYLAHPIAMRKEVRKWELQFEKKTGIELVNPFYDHTENNPESEDIKNFDEGKAKPNTLKNKDYATNIMEDDLDTIYGCNGIVAFVEPDQDSFGTPMEIFFNSYNLNRPTYIITKNMSGHAWILALGTQIFKSKKGFTQWITK